MRQQTIVLGSSGSGGGCGCLTQLFLLFTLVPLAELWLLLLLSRRVGFVPTLALVIFTGALGAWLARSQGLRAYAAVQAELAAGRMPTTSLLDGLMVLIAGAVLLTPGLLTDVFGFLLLVPWTRAWIRRLVAGRLRSRFVTVSPESGAGFSGTGRGVRHEGDDVIYVDRDEDASDDEVVVAEIVDDDEL